MIISGIRKTLRLNRGNTFGINLPMEWVKYIGLKHKDELNFFADEILIIYPKNIQLKEDELMELISKKIKKNNQVEEILSTDLM
ncbi:MAG: hypothetical protein PHN56_07360 [Candidatus Nanoarchaeia archaeon]|nr:hypothetical protein [Candidatus Nanoarchaeia archaeon]